MGYVDPEADLPPLYFDRWRPIEARIIAARTEPQPPDAAQASCTKEYCDRPAVTAVHTTTGHPLIRPDHMAAQWAPDHRCLDCALEDVADAIAAGPVDVVALIRRRGRT